MSDLVAFLRARVAEDEQHAQKDLRAAARATASADWDALYGYNLPHSFIAAPAGSKTRIAEFTSHRQGPPLADGEDDLHDADVGLAVRMVRAARPRAEHTLREVEAKRAILEHYSYMQRYGGVPGNENLDADGFEDYVLRPLAAVYRDHPDYDPEWAV